LAINYALGYLPATLVSPTLLAQPVLTALLAGPLLGEQIGSWQAVAGLGVLAGILIVHRSGQDRRTARRAFR
jgi:drug/metabolite transporter (DMT)-like permease